jgi:hypothetical protein
MCRKHKKVNDFNFVQIFNFLNRSLFFFIRAYSAIDLVDKTIQSLNLEYQRKKAEYDEEM